LTKNITFVMNSLVKYDNPTLVSTGGKGKGKGGRGRGGRGGGGKQQKQKQKRKPPKKWKVGTITQVILSKIEIGWFVEDPCKWTDGRTDHEWFAADAVARSSTVCERVGMPLPRVTLLEVPDEGCSWVIGDVAFIPCSLPPPPPSSSPSSSSLSPMGGGVVAVPTPPPAAAEASEGGAGEGKKRLRRSGKKGKGATALPSTPVWEETSTVGAVLRTRTRVRVVWQDCSGFDDTTAVLGHPETGELVDSTSLFAFRHMQEHDVLPGDIVRRSQDLSAATDEGVATDADAFGMVRSVDPIRRTLEVAWSTPATCVQAPFRPPVSEGGDVVAGAGVFDTLAVYEVVPAEGLELRLGDCVERLPPSWWEGSSVASATWSTADGTSVLQEGAAAAAVNLAGPDLSGAGPDLSAGRSSSSSKLEEPEGTEVSLGGGDVAASSTGEEEEESETLEWRVHRFGWVSGYDAGACAVLVTDVDGVEWSVPPLQLRCLEVAPIDSGVSRGLGEEEEEDEDEDAESRSQSPERTGAMKDDGGYDSDLQGILVTDIDDLQAQIDANIADQSGDDEAQFDSDDEDDDDLQARID
jgi:hypothetical protein